MDSYTVQEAYEMVLWDRDICMQKLKMKDANRSDLKKRFKQGKVTIDTMRNTLTKCGFKLVQEERWEMGKGWS